MGDERRDKKKEGGILVYQRLESERCDLFVTHSFSLPPSLPSSPSSGPRPYFQDLALMAEAAADMPVDFLTHPEKAYYYLGGGEGEGGREGGMKTCRLITGTWQWDGQHGYHPFFLEVKEGVREMVRREGYSTFDVAPFYGQVERWLGEVRMKIEDPMELEAYKVREGGKEGERKGGRVG